MLSTLCWSSVTTDSTKHIFLLLNRLIELIIDKDKRSYDGLRRCGYTNIALLVTFCVCINVVVQEGLQLNTLESLF